jgi:hypothetical protein
MLAKPHQCWLGAKLETKNLAKNFAVLRGFFVTKICLK